MKYSLILIAGLVCTAFSPPPAPSFCGAQSLCTLFARNNGGSIGGAVYFDVTAVSDVDICGFDINTAELTAAGLEVWTTPGTYVGNEANIAVWTQVAVDDGTGMGMGNDIPTPITLLNPFTLPTGSWGMALVAVGVGHDYTTGGASSTLQYTDGTLTIDLGGASNVPFTGGIFDPRIWNGCIHYGGGSVGTQYCPGDGVGAGCPCGNSNNGSMGGCDWGDPAFPEGGVLDATGSASFAANDTNLTATGVDNDFGIFFGANNQVNGGFGNPLNDGLRCAGGGLVRLIPPTLAAGNMATTPSPIQTLDTGAAAGVTRNYQYWFRTPAGPCGNTANLTNGYEIVWAP